MSSQNSKTRTSKVWTTCVSLGEFIEVEIQVCLRSGLPRFDIIGLPQNVIREGKDRILTALHLMGIDFKTHRILVSLSPSDVPKEGSHFDLPILAGILHALGALQPPSIEMKQFFWGEINLDGGIRPPRDLAMHLLNANGSATSAVFTSPPEAKSDLQTIGNYLNFSRHEISNVVDLWDEKIFSTSDRKETISNNSESEMNLALLDRWQNEITSEEKKLWNSLQGSSNQFKFWCVVALGRHHALIEGAPGVGKSTWCLASRALHPPLNLKQAKERYRFGPSHRAHLFSSCSPHSLWNAPFEAPHHSSTKAAIVGGGTGQIAVGAITRANFGTLFLDEFLEYSRDVLEALREPLEQKAITLSRQGLARSFPADTQILAAFNPCRCGRFGSGSEKCDCTATSFQSYRARLSQPLQDRFHFYVKWKFILENGGEGFDLKFVRRRLQEAKNLERIDLTEIRPSKNLSPRRLALVLQTFESFCRWEFIQKPSQQDFQNFINFLQSIQPESNPTQEELTDDKTEIDLLSIARRAREYRTSNSGSHMEHGGFDLKITQGD